MNAPTKAITVLVCITIVLAGGGAWTQEVQQPAATPEEVLRQFSGLVDWYSGDTVARLLARKRQQNRQ